MSTMRTKLWLAVDYPDDLEIENQLKQMYRQQIQDMISSRKSGDLYQDSGFDLYVPDTIVTDNGTKQQKIDHHVIVGCFSYYPNQEKQIEKEIPLPFYLYPRSSISKTPLRLANQVGIIDSGYRGHIISKVDVLSSEKEYTIEKYTRLFQLCSHNLLPFYEIELVDKEHYRVNKTLTQRGDGGFGSTGITKRL